MEILDNEIKRFLEGLKELLKAHKITHKLSEKKKFVRISAKTNNKELVMIMYEKSLVNNFFLAGEDEKAEYVKNIAEKIQDRT